MEQPTSGPDPGEVDRGWEQAAQEHFGVTHLNLPPRLLDDGSPNPEHFRALSSLLNTAGQSQIYGDGEKAAAARKINLNHQLTALDRSCVLHGFDPKHIMDARTQAEKALDAANKLQKTPREMLEAMDEELDALEAAMEQADTLCKKEIDEICDSTMEKAKLRGDSDPKAWRVRIERVRRLKDRARHDFPKRSRVCDRRAYEAAHLLRYLVYVGRSSSGRGDGASAVYKIYPHMARVSVGIWEAENGVAFEKGLARKGRIRYEGCIIEMGPGFGKTTLVNHWAARRISESPRDTGIFLHAVESVAKESLGFVANYFKDDNEGGRRNLSLFPGLRVYRNNTGELHMDTPNRTKTPTAQATGVGSAGLGKDHLWQIYDDVVPQDDVDQETERKRRYSRIVNTWMSRLRGDEHFWLYTGYPWHRDDATMRLENDARRESERVAKLIRSGQKMAKAKVAVRVIRIPCGGPDSVPKFKSICPEMKDSSYLRGVYHRDRHGYSANYRLQPLDEAMRLVSRLRLYDPADEDHIEFARGAVNHLSLDPTATNHGRGDKAGVMLLAQGELKVPPQQEGTIAFEKRIRVLDVHEIGATQTELTNFFGDYAQTARIDYVHVETRSGFVATAEMIENTYGIDVIRYDPTNKKKGDRLRAVAPMLNDGNAHLGVRACVELPGRRDDEGRIVPDYERYSRLYEQILDFGVVQDDHLVDCLTQVLIYLAPHMDIGLGAISEQVKRAQEIESQVVQAKRKLFEEANRGDDSKDPGQEEVEFFSSWN